MRTGVCTFASGTVVTLAGTNVKLLQARTYSIQWTGCDVPPARTEPCVVTMRGDRAVTARLRGTA